MESLDNFREITKEEAYNSSFKGERFGQSVFNYVNRKYGIANSIQFEDKIDCSHNDKYVDSFLEAVYNRVSNKI